MKLIQPLFDGPIDIVGDIHGEIDAVRLLLWHLGYDKQGLHPDGRRLVFAGDLVDRGPNSPAVIELVKEYVRDGRAQCILGNHELNLLRGDSKPGNEWFMAPNLIEQPAFKSVTAEQKDCFIEFLQTLPLALANKHLRVVHACWCNSSISKLEELGNSSGVLAAYGSFERGLNPKYSPPDRTRSELKAILKNLKSTPPFMPDLAEHDAAYQMGNPIRVLTSGIEAPATEPFKAGGKWRMVARQKWWDDYEDEIPVIIGHYWRRFSELPPEMTDKGGPDLFEGVESHHWTGKNNNVYCVDFSVGLRHKCREENWPEYLFKLAAFRWPEEQVMHDDGTCSELSPSKA